MTLPRLVDTAAGLGPFDLTLWVREKSAQANIRESGSSGWSCYTKATPAEALRCALENYVRVRGQGSTEDDIDALL